MLKKKYLYPLMIMILAVYIVYVLYINFIHDPQATRFLIHKTNLPRPINLPVWLNVMYVHVIFGCLAILTGAINFSTNMLKRSRKLHRINGYLYIVSVMIVVLTSGYMAPTSTGGKINSWAFNMINIFWPWMTLLALVRIKQKDVNNHRKWMVRSYAFCFTNLFIHLITSIFYYGVGMPYATAYTIGVYGTIFVNFALAEMVIRYLFRIPTQLLPAKPSNNISQ